MCFAILLFFSCLCTSVSGQIRGGTSISDFLGKSSDHKRPVIYTFIYVAGTTASLEQEPILVWAEAWADAGWDPVVLTEIDSSKHIQYESVVQNLSSSGIQKKGWSRLLCYLAMSSQPGGGYYTESHVLPIHHVLSFHERGHQLPNEGKFTTHDGVSMSLVSGSQQEWDRITSAIIHADEENIHNDMLILRLLNQKNRNETISEDSIVNARFVLGLKEKMLLEVKPLCKRLQDKKALKLTTGIHSVGFNSHRAYYRAVKSLLNRCKPIMHTYFELAYGKKAEKSLLVGLEEWKKAWVGAGWHAIVLTLADAKLHPLYENFTLAFEEAHYKTSSYDQMCFYRWLAMAASPVRGWMSDYDTYPLHLDHNMKYKYDLPNDGNFTSNAYFVPNLLSGSHSEWNRMVKLLFTSYQSNSNKQWSDMHAMQEIIKKQSKSYIYTDNAPELHTIYTPSNIKSSVPESDDFKLKRVCSRTKGKLAVHFSHSTCRKVGFCHNNRGPVLTKWLEYWRRYCIHQQT